jgi:hypothetical protein
MAVVTPRETWTDERLGEFKASVNQRFDEVDRRLDQMDEDIRELRLAVTGVQRTIAQGCIGICAVMIAGFTALASGVG